MSKSLGNVVSLEAAIERFGPMVLRFYYLNAQYRSPLNFVEGESLEEARRGLRTSFGPVRSPDRAVEIGGVPERAGRGAPDRPRGRVTEHDRAAGRRALERLQHPGGDRPPVRVGAPGLRLTGGLLMASRPSRYRPSCNRTIGGARSSACSRRPFPPETTGRSWAVVEVALAARARARERGDFAEADRIRASLGEAGVLVEDHGGTRRWKVARGTVR